MIEDRSNTVRMLTSTSNGDIWVGTRTGGLYIYDSKFEVQKKKLHHGINIYAVCEDNKGNLWLATRGEGIWIGDVKYRYDKLDEKSLSSDNVFCMMKDRKGRMWIGTFGGGLNLAVPTADGRYEFRHFLLALMDSEKLVLCVRTVMDGFGLARVREYLFSILMN